MHFGLSLDRSCSRFISDDRQFTETLSIDESQHFHKPFEFLIHAQNDKLLKLFLTQLEPLAKLITFNVTLGGFVIRVSLCDQGRARITVLNHRGGQNPIGIWTRFDDVSESEIALLFEVKVQVEDFGVWVALFKDS